MPRPPTNAELAAQLRALLEREQERDQLVTDTAKRLDKQEERLDRHMATSQDVHRELRADVKVLQHRVDDLTPR